MPSSLVAALSYTYAVQADIEQHISVLGLKLRLDDDSDGVLSTAEQAGLTDAIDEATETINYYCNNKYAASQLATSRFINRACMILATYRICTRRLNPVPESLIEDAAKVEEMLKEIRDKSALIPGLPLRRILAPTMSHTRLVPIYSFRVIRVERQNSSQHNKTSLGQNVDYQEAATIERA